MPSDFYLVLGISRNADANKIKKAYRRIVKQVHPDTTEWPQDSEKFREIQEAYETLGDEEKRRQYDSEQTRHHGSETAAGIKKTASNRPNMADEMGPYYSYTDDFLGGFLPGFFTKNRFQSPVKDMVLEAILSPREALEGGIVPITIPVIEPCPQCRPSRVWERFFCPICSGYGKIKSKREFSLTIPPRTKNGTEISIMLDDIGLKNIRLNIFVSIDPNMTDDEW